MKALKQSASRDFRACLRSMLREAGARARIFHAGGAILLGNMVADGQGIATLPLTSTHYRVGAPAHVEWIASVDSPTNWEILVQGKSTPAAFSLGESNRWSADFTIPLTATNSWYGF